VERIGADRAAQFRQVGGRTHAGQFGARGFRTILATEPGQHAYISAWWPAGHIIGHEHTHTHIICEFLRAVAKGEPPSPNFFDGWRNNMILDAVERSATSGKWETTA
jgi:predicted dehydrogenase